VVVVGIPYPNVKDTQVQLKKDYNSGGAARTRGLISGDQWYSQQAFRALNQVSGCPGGALGTRWGLGAGRG
jgi:fanconi anemia group J protein